MSAQELINLKGVSKTFGHDKNRFFALSGVDLTVQAGESLAITGPSGSGKSTLLHIIGLLDDLTYGSYMLHGGRVDHISGRQKAWARNRTFGLVVQDFALIERYSVRQNIEIPLLYRKPRMPRKARMRAIDKVSENLGISDKLKAKAWELSGGQRQRVAIARAIVNEPEVILADEPTGALDTQNSRVIMDLFTQLVAQGKTLVVVTHDQSVAARCNRVLALKDGRLGT
ncbi:MAG: ABC transporter ATP-binding protein [Coriobacteriales bacterium]|jgi:putative ABC transport system ATP-binding protein|nr:ABC transporter ATP-binding protein [Coriobacteriales bacterium]